MNFKGSFASAHRSLSGGLVLLALVGFAGFAHGASSIDDTFDGAALDWCRWEEFNYKGAVAQLGELALTPDGTEQFTRAGVLSQARLVGDFDIQVDFRFGAGLAQSPTSGGLNIALGVYWDDARSVTLARARLLNGDGFHAFASIRELAPNNSFFVGDTTGSGTLRLVRVGNQLRLTYRASAATPWTDVATFTVPASPVHATLSAFNSGTLRAFTAYLDNFKVNTGSTDDISYTQPAFFDKRPEFAVAALVENYPSEKHGSHGWIPVDFFDFAKSYGVDWVKTSVTTQSFPQLTFPPPQWQPEFWSSRQWAAETLRQAAARGLRQEVQLLLSPGAAFWGNQTAPPEWGALTPDQIVPLLEQNVFETVSYFKEQGLNVEKYALGNEIDIGILDFLPNRRVPVPPGVAAISDFAWMRSDVWAIEAQLLKAAAAGVKRADPSAKTIVHIAGLDFTPGNVFASAFFEAMRDFGVPFDYAALSIPYPYGPWKLDRYPTACWFKRLALTVDRISAITGKPVMFVEASYPSAPGPGILAAPMRDFPFSEAGQAAWIREQLRFASSRPNIAGWHYFYPDMAPNLFPGNDSAQVLTSSSLFVTDQQPRLGWSEFGVNQQQVFGNHQGLWWADPAGSESGWGINFADQGNTIFATWFTYDSAGKPWWLGVVANKIAPGVYSGDLFTTTGPPFNSEPFDSTVVVETTVGTATLTFTDDDHATFAYTVNAATTAKSVVTQTKALTRQQFGPLPACDWSAQRNLATNYQDLWWKSPAGSESGWGINLTHQGDAIFATWFTYDASGNPRWLAFTANKTALGVYVGDVFTTSGPPFNAVPFDPSVVVETTVGVASLTFSDGDHGNFGYTVNGVSQVKPIARQVFAPFGTICK